MNAKTMAIIILIVSIHFLRANLEKDHLGVLVVNYQKDCKFCLKREISGGLSFSQCPISFKQETRFNFHNTDKNYIYMIKSVFENLVVDSQEEFYLFPVFSDNKMMISSTVSRKCLTNVLNNPDYDDTPIVNQFEDFFTNCDYSGASESQLFVFENTDQFQFSKYNIIIYYASNPALPNSNLIVPLSDIDYLRSIGLYFYLSYDGPTNQSLKYELISNEFVIYLPSPIPKNQVYSVYSISPTIPGDYCVYDISFRDVPYKTIPYYDGFRCFEFMKLTLNVNKTNNVVFKIKDATNNKAETTDRILDGSTINFNLTSHTSANSPYTYTNILGKSSFTKSLEFGTYSLMLTLSNTNIWRYDVISFQVNSCNYIEVEIPIYLKEYDIVFRFKNDSTNVYVDNLILQNMSSIEFKDPSSGILKYSYTINHFQTISEFTLTMLYGTYYVFLTVNNSSLHEYVTQVVYAHSNSIFDIKIYEIQTDVIVKFYDETTGQYVTTGFLPDDALIDFSIKSVNVGITKDSQLNITLPVGTHNISLPVRYPLIMTFTGPFSITIPDSNPVTIELKFSTIIFDFVPDGKVYLPLPSGNYSTLANISWDNPGGTDVKTTWQKIQVYPYSLDDIWIDVDDYTFSTSSGQTTSTHYAGTRTEFAFASAYGCENPNSIDATAVINLTSTKFSFKIGAESKFGIGGYMPNGTTTISSDRKSATITGGGYCGGNSCIRKSGTQDICDGLIEYVP